MDAIDKKIIIYFSKDIPLSKDLYKDISKNLHIEEKELIERLKNLKEKKMLKRIAPVMRHEKSGYTANAMAVWKGSKDQLKKATDLAKSFKNISHIYEREVCMNWPYNLYTMIHGQSKEEVEKIINYLSNKLKIKEFKVLYTEKEHKKISPNLEVLLSEK